MTYESLLSLLQRTSIRWEGICPFKKEPIKDERGFKTLTVWYGKDGYKISVRWASGADCSSKYCSTLEAAYKDMLANFKEEYGKHDWQFTILPPKNR